MIFDAHSGFLVNAILKTRDNDGNIVNLRPQRSAVIILETHLPGLSLQPSNDVKF